MEDKITVRNILGVVGPTLFAFGMGANIANYRANRSTPIYDRSNNRLDAKVYSVVNNGKSLFDGSDIEFFVTDETGGTVKVVRNQLEGKHANDVILREYVKTIQNDTSNRNIIFFGQYENDIKKIEYSVKPNGTIVPVRTFNADYALTKDGSLFPIMK